MYNKNENFLILTALKKNPIHPTAETLYNLIKHDYPRIGKSTVYRHLITLEKKGYIRKLEGLDTCKHYDHTLTPHFHFICTKCGKIDDIPFAFAQGLEKKASSFLKSTVLSCEANLKGVCSDCQTHPTKGE